MHVYLKSALLILAVNAVLVIDSPFGFSCSCARRATVLQLFESSDLVVIARFVSVEKVDKFNPNRIRAAYDGKSAKAVVEKTYKGKAEIGNELIFDQEGGSDCIETFSEEDIGQRFLFYLHKPLNNYPRYAVGACSGSKTIRWAADDLLYLDNLDKVRGRTRISGTLLNRVGDGFGFAGREIKILQNDKVWETTTNENGVYEIYDLPPGEYLVEPEIPLGWKIDTIFIQSFAASFSGNKNGDRKTRIRQIPIILEKGKHAGLDISFDIDKGVALLD
jgi:hypothetical protein